MREDSDIDERRLTSTQEEMSRRVGELVLEQYLRGERE